MMLSRFSLFAIMIIMSLSSFGQNLADSVLMDLSLEDLMGQFVTSASKQEESVFDAPSIIQTISAKEIDDFGGDNLYEILERATSFYGISSFVFPQNIIGLRGDYSTHISPNILFLIDGRPFRESIKGGQNVGILTTFPVVSIKQIEIIRGPGSVLYGSNAYTGVVNIITKKTTEPTLHIAGGGGSLNTSEARVYGGTSVGELNINGGLNFFKTDGWEFADSTRAGGFGQTNFGQDVLSFNANMNYKSFTLSTFLGQNEMGHIRSVRSDSGLYMSKRFFVDLGYKKELIEDVYTLSANVTYNRINDVFTTVEEQTLLSNDFLIEVTNFVNVSDDLDFTLGGTVAQLAGEQRNGAGFSVPNYNKKWYNAYLVGNYKATDWLKMVVGAQLNKVPNVDVSISPRFALIANHDMGMGIKLMYGQAFRAPYAGETDIDIPPVVTGDPNLFPTTVATTEAQVFYNGDKGSIALSYFMSTQKDLIGRKVNPDSSGSPQVYDNLGERIYSGLELEGKYIPVEHLFFTGSYAYQINKDDDENENISFLPNHMLKMGVSYELKHLAKIGVFNSYYSTPHAPEGSVNGLGNLSDFNWLTAKIEIYLGKLLKIKTPYLALTLEGVNLLDETVYNPEIANGNYNATRAKQGRGFYLGAVIRL